jgi:hypothetical protein
MEGVHPILVWIRSTRELDLFWPNKAITGTGPKEPEASLYSNGGMGPKEYNFHKGLERKGICKHDL